MSMGIAVIASKVEGNLELVKVGISGLLVEPKNAQAIADKALELLECEQARESHRPV